MTFVKEDFIRQQGMTGWVDEYALSMMPREALVTKTVAVSNEPLTITVKPCLKREGQPASMGQWVILSWNLPAKNRFALNETGFADRGDQRQWEHDTAYATPHLWPGRCGSI